MALPEENAGEQLQDDGDEDGPVHDLLEHAGIVVFLTGKPMGLINSEPPKQSHPIEMLGLDGKPVSYTAEQLAGMDHASLYLLRERNAQNREVFSILAPFEHQAFAREATSENLGMAVPIALATPLYAGAKAAGFMRNDGEATDPSLAQVGRGLMGVGQGIAHRVKQSLR